MTRMIDAWPRLKRKELPGADPALDYRPAVPSVLDQTDMLLLDCAVTAHMPDEPSRIIELTSPTLGEGTSTIARELAMTIAGHLSKPVMLIRAVNDLPLSPGLEAVAHGRIPLEAVVETDLDVPTLTTATLSLGGSNAGLLFDGDELDRVFAQAARLPAGDYRCAAGAVQCHGNRAFAQGLGRYSHRRSREDPRPDHRAGAPSIETGGGRVLGVILNKRKHHIPGWLYRRL